MSIKNIIKKSSIYPFINLLRYGINRFIIERSFCNVQKINRFLVHDVFKGINFFGYYNLSPENANGDVLFLKIKNENIRGSLIEPADIMLKKTDGTVVTISQTKAWNWQQGCMLQWMPGTNNQLIFNDYDELVDEYYSRVLDTSGNTIKVFSKAIYNVSKCGSYALSLNFSRLAAMRPDYGYFNKSKIKLIENDKDGIWHINLKSGSTKLIISLEQLINLSPTDSMEGALHKVNHIDINPNGTNFMFLHRWKGPKGRFMRLVTASSDGCKLKILNGDKMTSHCCWLNNEEILSFCDYKGKIGYFKFNNKTQSVIYFSNKMPLIDGHPSISPNGRWIITDTYPNRARFSSLYLYDLEAEKIEKIGSFFQPLKYRKEMRVDLHPKWSNDSKAIYFESAHQQVRKLYRIKVHN